jgi:uncharacterized RDD family membrane protein YckC
MRIVDGLPVFYIVGLVAVAASRKHQRLGDMVANTLVVQQRQPKRPDSETIYQQTTNR